MSPKNVANNVRGFTLLEVLVALAVVALALTALIKSGGDMTGNIAYLQEKTRAHWIAMDRITELRVAREWPSTGTKRDEVEMYGVDWTWMQQISETSVEDMRRVDVSVFLTEHGDEDYPLSTMTGFLVHPRLLEPRAAGASNNPIPGGGTGGTGGTGGAGGTGGPRGTGR